MCHNFFKLLPIVLALTASLSIFASEGMGDIIETSELSKSAELFREGGESVGPRPPLRLQCWQEGRKIIDQNDLYGMSLKPILEQDSVSFKRKGTQGFAVHIISVDDTICLVQARP